MSQNNKDDKELGWPETNAPKNPVSTGGNPRQASNRNMMRGHTQHLTRYAAGRFISSQVKSAAQGMPVNHEPSEKLRSRSEVVIYNEQGIVGIKKDGYLLMPGGGIDPGETPEFGAYRESIEEADRKLLHLRPMGCVEAVWPEGKKLVDGFDGERSYLFIALDGGELGTEHADNESFDVIPFDEAISFLDKLIGDPEQAWAKQVNQLRRECIEEASKATTTPIKLAEEAQPTELSGSPAVANQVNGIPGAQSDIASAVKPAHPIHVEKTVDPAVSLERATSQFEESVEQTKQAALNFRNVFKGGPDLQAVAALVNRYREKNQVYGPRKFELKPQPSDIIERFKAWYPPVATPVVPPVAKPPVALPVAPPVAPPVIKPKPGNQTDVPTDRITKKADAIHVIPRDEYMMFDPQDRVYAAPDQNKRFKFPNQGVGKRAPYEPIHRFIPPTGVPEPGIHGYDLSLNVGDTDPAGVPAFEGGEWVNPQDLLKSLYGSMGKKENLAYREIDRARARVILNHLKRKRKGQGVVQPPVVGQPGVPPIQGEGPAVNP